MYIIQNAWKSITRNKARNILIGIVVMVIAVSSCVALSIREAANKTKEEALSQMEITAQISFDRAKAMEAMQSNASGSGGGANTFDKSKLRRNALTLDEYLTYTQAQSEGDGSYYSMEASLNAGEGLQPYSSSDTEEESTAEEGAAEKNIQETETQPGAIDSQNAGHSGKGMMGAAGGEGSGNSSDSGDSSSSEANMGRGKGSRVIQGDFSLTGYSSHEAMDALFGQDGTCSITEGTMFTQGNAAYNCVISDELAMYNSLSVGDSIQLTNPNDEEETYTLNICGIYRNTASDSGNQTFSYSDPANNIYMDYTALSALVDQSTSAATEETADNVLSSQLNFTYTFANEEHYEDFAAKVYDLGLSDQYTVSSSNLSSYENSLTPMETLSTMALWFFLIVVGIGGIILIVLNIFILRERKYEVGVLTAIGMKKGKVALQFISELFLVTLMGMVIGTAAGAAVSVPVTNALLEKQVASAQEADSETNQNYGMGKGGMRGNAVTATAQVPYIESISTATDLTVVLKLALMAIALTILSGLAAMITIMRYEPLKILSSRS